MIFQRSGSGMTVMVLTMSRQQIDMFMLFLMIEWDSKTAWISESAGSSYPGYITFHGSPRKTQQELLSWYPAALAGLLYYLTCFRFFSPLSVHLSAGVATWHFWRALVFSMQPQLYGCWSQPPPNPWKWLPALWDVGHQECHRQSRFTGERTCLPFKNGLP